MNNFITFLCIFSACIFGYVSAVGAGAGALTSKNAVRYGYRPASMALVMEAMKKLDMNRLMDTSPRRESLLDVLDSGLEYSRCFGRRCHANGHCCENSVCVEVEGVGGSCFPVSGVGRDQLCSKDHDCSAGLLCVESLEDDVRTCQPQVLAAVGEKQYNDECLSSSECAIARGLCCQTQRRHRQTTKRRCLYFRNAGVCLGTVDI